MNDLTHTDDEGRLRMVDVGAKAPTRRQATAEGFLVADRNVVERVREERGPKGSVLEAARLAGILAAKRTSELIPLSHPLLLDHVAVDFELEEARIRILATVSCRGPTGVEMEALTAVAVAGLTVYDMIKARSRTPRLEGVRLLAKSGGRSGEWRADRDDDGRSESE